MAAPAFRVEVDTPGSRELPADALYGAQADRAVENFPISGRTPSEWPRFIHALARVKQASAFANFSLGTLPEQKYRAIAAAGEEIRSGVHNGAFVVEVFQGEAGTSTNMNINEVVVNVALRHLGQKPGTYEVLHPIDDVNMSQSANDVYPTAARLATIDANVRLTGALKRVVTAFRSKGREFGSVQNFGYYGVMIWLPSYLSHRFGYTLTRSAVWTGATILGMAFGIWLFGQLADRFGRRPIFFLYQAGAGISVVGYSQLTDPSHLLVGGAIMGMFVNGMLGGYGALMSELYPTEVRATAQNVLFNFGRAVGGFGPLVVGALASAYSFAVAIALLSTLYVVDIVATAVLIPERKGAPLT